MIDVRGGPNVRRLIDSASRQRIKQHNLRKNSRYPKHQQWMSRTLDALERDDYSRIAFGAHLRGSGAVDVLCCSVIVTVSAFTPYLELKNLIVFDGDLPADFDNNVKRSCIDAILDHVQKFASDRGYAKLLFELFRDDAEDRLVTQCCLARGFTIVGAQARRYTDSDDVVYLAWDVHAIYGYDPYDCRAASHWIISQYISGAQLVPETDDWSPSVRLVVEQRDGGSVDVNLPLRLYDSGKLELLAARKLNDKILVLDVPDYFEDNHKVKGIKYIEFACAPKDRLVVFNFGHDLSNWLDQLIRLAADRAPSVTLLERQELNSLLYSRPGYSEAAAARKNALRHRDVGGMITLSDPGRFQIERVQRIFQQGMQPIYVKLGPKGKSLTTGHLLVFSYFDPHSVDGSPSIWGIGEVDVVDDKNFNNSLQLGEDNDEATQLFELMDLDDNSEPIWDRDDFTKHNRYNASNEVVLVHLAGFHDLRKSRLPIDSVSSDRDRTEVLARELDNYLSRTETESIERLIRSKRGPYWTTSSEAFDEINGTPIAETRLGADESVRVLCVHSDFLDKPRVDPDFQDVREILKGRLHFADVIVEAHATRAAVRETMRRIRPHVLHISAHASGGEISLRTREGDEAPVNGDWLQKRIDLEAPHLQLIVFCCCESVRLAKELSANGRAAIGFHGGFSEAYAQPFNSFFYSALSVAVKDRPVIYRVAEILRDHSYPDDKQRPELFFDGNVVDYRNE